MEERKKMQEKTKQSSLLAQARAGNEAAINELVLSSWPQAYKVALRILRSHTDAEEVAQDSVWMAIRHLATFRENASFRTWLHRIAVNKSIMALRYKRSRALDGAVELNPETPPSDMAGPRTPEDLVLQDENRRLIDARLS